MSSEWRKVMMGKLPGRRTRRRRRDLEHELRVKDGGGRAPEPPRIRRGTTRPMIPLQDNPIRGARLSSISMIVDVAWCYNKAARTTC